MNRYIVRLVNENFLMEGVVYKKETTLKFQWPLIYRKKLLSIKGFKL